MIQKKVLFRFSLDVPGTDMRGRALEHAAARGRAAQRSAKFSGKNRAPRSAA